MNIVRSFLLCCTGTTQLKDKMPLRVGILGCGRLGKFLCEKIAADEEESFQLVFLWNRDPDKAISLASHFGELLLTNSDRSRVLTTSELDKNPEAAPESTMVHVLRDLENGLQVILDSQACDLIIEVAHPDVTRAIGSKILSSGCDYFVGSPTALADRDLWDSLSLAASTSVTNLDRFPTLFVGTGAFWGADDIRKLADSDALSSLEVTMRKHPLSLKLAPGLMEKLGEDPASLSEPITLYEGPVRGLCPMAPNNVNTMAVGAICAHNLGFDGVVGRLIADPDLLDMHVVEIEAKSRLASNPLPGEGGAFMHAFQDDKHDYLVIKTTRSNPAAVGAVTGNATFNSFWYSLLNAAKLRKVSTGVQRRRLSRAGFAVVC